MQPEQREPENARVIGLAADVAVEAVRARRNDKEIIFEKFEADLAAVGDDLCDDGIIGGGEICIPQVIIGHPDAFQRIAPGKAVLVSLGDEAKPHRRPDRMAAVRMRDLPEPPHLQQGRAAAGNPCKKFRVDGAGGGKAIVGLKLRRRFEQLAAKIGVGGRRPVSRRCQRDLKLSRSLRGS